MHSSVSSFFVQMCREGLSIFSGGINLKDKILINYFLFFRYLATGCYFADLHYAYRLGKSTVIEIIKKTVDVVWRKLKESVMKIPSTEEWEKITRDFEKYTNFPNCIGAIDGKHIRIIKPLDSGSMYLNYKHIFQLYCLQCVMQITASLILMLEHVERVMTQRFSNTLNCVKNLCNSP